MSNAMAGAAYQECILSSCKAQYSLDEVIFACGRCGGPLDVRYDWSRFPVPSSMSFFETRWSTAGRSKEAVADYSGVWRFRELLPFADLEDLVSVGEGRTTLQQADQLAAHIGVKPEKLYLQYEGFNPSGSFKDNGMAAAFTMARRLDRSQIACASTGNTSASMALFAAKTLTRSGKPMQASVFVGGGKIAFGKLSQALDHGARTIQIEGDFDACMRLVQQSAESLGWYLMNSVNPFRLEGQKAIMYRILEGLDWEVPDWIIVPGGNLGNSSAFGKAYQELLDLGLVKRAPRLAIINASGANTLYELYNEHGLRFARGAPPDAPVQDYYKRMKDEGRAACTVASAIEIGRPVNLIKALRSLELMDGEVRQVPDEDILDAKALIGRYGYGCEPASAASVAGLCLLLKEQIISPSDRVVCILTGHGLKDSDATVDYHMGKGGECDAPAYANPPVSAPDDIEAIAKLLAE